MIIAILGPTAVGKTALSIALAKKYNAEIINFDAMQVYEKLDIGTAKVTREEMEGVPHHLLSFVSLDKNYSVYFSNNDILRIIDKLNLSSEKDKIYAKYSLGTKQKLGIAQVLMENPDIIILDEPLNGIEKLTAEKIREILKEEKEKGKLIIIASHIKEDIDFLADEVYEIDSGKVIKIK